MAYHAKESLNFQISVAIYVIVLVFSIIGLLLVWAVAVAAFVLVIIATIRAAEGQLYKYPLCIRIIK